MLGHQVVNYFLKFDDYNVIDIAFRTKLRKETIISNAKDKMAFENVITELCPDVIVNCIGVLIPGSSNVENAIYLNAYLPHQLKNISKNISAKLIHISTDCVFSGDRGAYIESDVKDGTGVYSQTKILGEIEDDTKPLDILRATFPAGTVSGAPKIRAMEIINELEPLKRGIYSGAIGYLSWTGDLDTALSIRTAVIKDNLIHVQAGAGIVYDSVPETEWEETMNKAMALLKASEKVNISNEDA